MARVERQPVGRLHQGSICNYFGNRAVIVEWRVKTVFQPFRHLRLGQRQRLRKLGELGRARCAASGEVKESTWLKPPKNNFSGTFRKPSSTTRRRCLLARGCPSALDL